jgi:hypothetical protein
LWELSQGYCSPCLSLLLLLHGTDALLLLLLRGATERAESVSWATARTRVRPSLLKRRGGGRLQRGFCGFAFWQLCSRLRGYNFDDICR